MIDVMALRAGRGENGGVGNGGKVVAADGPRQNGRDRHDEEIHIIRRDNGEHNRNQNAEGPPRSPGRKSKPDCDAEENGREEHFHGRVSGDDTGDVAADIEVFFPADPG